MKLHYIANARMPSEKAHGIQIAKMCEAFVERGVDLVLVVPARKSEQKSLKEFYALRQDMKIITLPALDWYTAGRVGYNLSTLSFMLSCAWYLLTRVNRGDIVYTVDLDHLAYGVLTLTRAPVFSEMHGGKPDTSLHRSLFKKLAGVIATNSITKEQLKKTFGLPEERFITEPNGVDFSVFTPMTEIAARERLQLPQKGKLALYIGRFFDWKGLGILPDAAKLLPNDISIGLVGGTEEEFARVAGKKAERLTFFGSKPYAEMPLWEAAADTLVVLGTHQDEQSWNYTSPMKVFEYMAMKRPIVASRTPALQNILSAEECYFYEPDNALDLARAIAEAASGDDSRTSRAYERVRQYAWDLRAERILAFIKNRITA
jgi:glycosyltransferase involved in cell wall biosynthesis